MEFNRLFQITQKGILYDHDYKMFSKTGQISANFDKSYGKFQQNP
jgi:hypothetical protein